MKRKLLYLSGALGILLLIATAAFYYLSTVLSNKDVKEFLITQIERHMPKTTVNIEHITYRLGPSLLFEIQGLDIKLKENRPGRELFFVSKAFIQIPLLAFFSPSTVTDIIISSPQISYYEFQDGVNNWSRGRGKKRPQPKPPPAQQKQPARPPGQLGPRTIFSALLKNSNVHIRLDRTTIHYQTKEDIHGELFIKKFLLKNALSNSAAFEIQSSLKKFTLAQGQLSSNLLLIGEADILALLEQGRVKSKVELRLTENQWSSAPLSLPDIKAEALLTATPSEGPSALLHLHAGDVLELQAKVLPGEALRLEQLNAHISLAPALKMLGLKASGLELKNAKINIQGLAVLAKPWHLDLQIKSLGKVRYSLLDDPLAATLSGVLKKKNQLNLKAAVESTAGTGTITLQTTLPKELEKTSLTRLSNNKLRLRLRRIKITQRDLQRLLLLGMGKKAPPPTLPSATRTIPDFRLHLEAENITLGKTQLAFKGLVISKNNHLQSKDFSLGIGGGKAKVNFSSSIKPRGIDTKFWVDMKKVNLDDFAPFAPGFWGKFSGLTTTQLQGTLNHRQGKTIYDITLNSSTTKGGIEQLELDHFLIGYADNIPALKKHWAQNQLKLSGQFEHLLIKGRLQNHRHQVKKIDFIGTKSLWQIQGHGQFFFNHPSNLSTIILTFKDRRPVSSKKLKQSIGTDTVPLRLTGKGWSVAPDYAYTLKKVTVTTAKAQGKKTVKRRGKKLLKKYLKEKNLDKANKLLKDIFK